MKNKYTQVQEEMDGGRAQLSCASYSSAGGGGKEAGHLRERTKSKDNYQHTQEWRCTASDLLLSCLVYQSCMHFFSFVILSCRCTPLLGVFVLRWFVDCVLNM